MKKTLYLIFRIEFLSVFIAVFLGILSTYIIPFIPAKKDVNLYINSEYEIFLGKCDIVKLRKIESQEVFSGKVKKILEVNNDYIGYIEKNLKEEENIKTGYFYVDSEKNKITFGLSLEEIKSKYVNIVLKMKNPKRYLLFNGRNGLTNKDELFRTILRIIAIFFFENFIFIIYCIPIGKNKFIK